MRCSMGEERRSSVALIHTHYDVEIDLDEAVNIYAKVHPRRLELISVLDVSEKRWTIDSRDQ